MSAFRAFATGFLKSLNDQHDDAREQETKWLEEAGKRFDAAYKAKGERDVKARDRQREINAAAAFLGGNIEAATYAVDGKLPYTNPDTWKQIMTRFPGKKQEADPATVQTQQTMVPQAPEQIQPQDAQQGPQAGQAAPGPRKVNVPVPDVFKPTIEAHAARTGTDANVIAAQFMVESGGRPEVVSGQVTSSAGAVGPMQTKPDTLRDPGYGIVPARDDSEEERWRVGTDYSAMLQKRYGNLPIALAAYHAGPGTIDKWVARGANWDELKKLMPKTYQYVQDVMGRLPDTALAQPGPTKQRAATLPPQAGQASATPSVTTQTVSAGMDRPAVQDAQETSPSPVQAPEGRSGWQRVGELLTGRRDPVEVARRGSMMAGKAYGLDEQQTLDVLSGADINAHEMQPSGMQMGFGEKPADQTEIVSSVVKDPHNFPDGRVQAVALSRLAKGDFAGALALADPLAVERAKAKIKAQTDSTTAYETLVLRAERLAKEKHIDFHQAWGLVNNTEGIVSDPVNGGFSYKDEAGKTVQDVQPVDPEGKPVTRVPLKERTVTTDMIEKSTAAIQVMDDMLQSITADPSNVGFTGYLKQQFGGYAAQLPFGVGESISEYLDLAGVQRLETQKAMLTGKLMPSITGDTSGRYSNADKDMVEAARGKLMTADASPDSIRSALETLKDVERSSRVRGMKKLNPQKSDKELWADLANLYARNGKDKDEAKRLASEDMFTLRSFTFD